MSEHYPGGFSLAKRVAAAIALISIALLSGCSRPGAEPQPTPAATEAYDPNAPIQQTGLALCDTETMADLPQIPDHSGMSSDELSRVLGNNLLTLSEASEMISPYTSQGVNPNSDDGDIAVAPFDSTQALLHSRTPHSQAEALVDARKPDESGSKEACIAASVSADIDGGAGLIQLTYGEKAITLTVPEITFQDGTDAVTPETSGITEAVADDLAPLVGSLVKRYEDNAHSNEPTTTAA